MKNGVAIATYTDREGFPTRAVIAVEGILRVDELRRVAETLSGAL